MKTLICDIETYPNYFLAAFMRVEDRAVVKIEGRPGVDIDRERLRKIMLSHRIITFNGMNFDVPIIFKVIEGAGPEEAHACAERIIRGGLRYWEVEQALDVTIPRALDHIDLIEPQPNAFASLKTLSGRLHARHMQDLPYEPGTELTPGQMEDVSEYCVNDLENTLLLYEALREPLELRAALSNEFDEDFRSKSDSQIGERIVRRRVEQMTGRRIQKANTKPGTTFRYKVPDFIRFETPQMQDVLERIRTTDFVIRSDGKIDLPPWLKDVSIDIGESRYSMGIGGLHSTESGRAVLSDDDHVLIDADVASQYPSIILKLGLYPEAVGPEFLDVYAQIRADRLAAKKAKDKVKDKGMKIALNGVYGKLGSRYSILYAPHLLISVTLTGQLTLLMLIERAEAAGIPVVSGNTDGVLFRCPRDLVDGIEGDRLTGGPLAEICEQWETDTGFALEFAEYKAIYNQNVNSYFAAKADNSIKQKGSFANPWREGGDLREQMMKNPQMTICAEAIIGLISEGRQIEETIRASRDIRQFVTVVKATGGAAWRGQYQGKVVRYYWSTDGEAMMKVKPNAKGVIAKVPKTDGCRPLMTFSDTFPDDIDYDRYINETRRLLRDFGYFAPALPAPRKSRRRPTPNTLIGWSLAA